MNKLLLALTILATGAGGLLTARQSTTRQQHEANAVREVWQAQTQRVAVAQSEQAILLERVRELKQALTQPQAIAESAVWSALQTNRADRLPPELRERLLEELGFNWQSSKDFIVVSKETVRNIHMASTSRGKLTESAAAVLAMTPGERGQVEVAIQGGQADFNDWALAHVERTEPKDDVVAHYSLPGSPAALIQSITNNFTTGVFDALGKERAELILPAALLPSAGNWMRSIGLGENPASMIIKRYLAGDEPRLKVQMQSPTGSPGSYDLPKRDFPPAFRPIFPNGWTDVAKREGFELPPEPQKN